MSDFTKKNIAHFDERAASYDASVFKTGLSTKAVNAFLAAPTVDWNPASTVVIDFACGTGLISEGLASHAKKLMGFDTSQAMIAQYNSKAEKAGVANKMKGFCVDILGGVENIPTEASRPPVDVVLCSLAYHHIEDATNTSKVLAALLKKGGHLLVLDLLETEISHKFHNHLLPKEGGHHGHHGHHAPGKIGEIVPHIGGLSMETLEEAFKATGMLDEISVMKVFAAEKEGVDYDFVLASGRKI